MPPDHTSRIPVAAADTLTAAILVAIGSSIRCGVLFLVALPITVAGFVVAPLAMWRTGTGPPLAWRARIGTLLVSSAQVRLCPVETDVK